MKRMDVSQLLEFCGDADISQAEDITASLCHSLEALGVLVADHLGVDFAGIEQSADGVLAGFVPRQPGDRCPAVLADCDEDGVWPGSPLRTLLVCETIRRSNSIPLQPGKPILVTTTSTGLD